MVKSCFSLWSNWYILIFLVVLLAERLVKLGFLSNQFKGIQLLIGFYSAKFYTVLSNIPTLNLPEGFFSGEESSDKKVRREWRSCDQQENANQQQLTAEKVRILLKSLF